MNDLIVRVLVVIAAVGFALYMGRKKTSRMMRKFEEAKPFYGPIVFPFTVGVDAKNYYENQKSAKFYGPVVFAIIGAIPGYIVGILYSPNDQRFGVLTAAAAAILFWTIGSFAKDMQPLDEGIIRRTGGREIIVDRQSIRISRALAESKSEFQSDDRDYFVFPVQAGSAVQVRTVPASRHSPGLFVYIFERPNEEPITISTIALGAAEPSFRAALTAAGLRIEHV